MIAQYVTAPKFDTKHLEIFLNFNGNTCSHFSYEKLIGKVGKSLTPETQKVGLP